MDDKNKIQSLNIVMNGITINGPMFDIHDNGTVNNYFTTSSEDKRMNASEAKVKDALLILLDATDTEGNRIFTEKGQWYAVYKVLSECHGYPTKVSEFCDIMTNWGMDKVTPACSYESVKKIPTHITATSNKVILWHNLKDKADPKFMKQIMVAMKLMELLEK
jgi:hypothetical protein